MKTLKITFLEQQIQLSAVEREPTKETEKEKKMWERAMPCKAKEGVSGTCQQYQNTNNYLMLLDISYCPKPSHIVSQLIFMTALATMFYYVEENTENREKLGNLPMATHN